MTVTHPSSDTPTDHYDHIQIHAAKLAEMLSVEGIVMSVWMEPESRYVHVLSFGESENSVEVVRGGYVDPRAHDRPREKL